MSKYGNIIYGGAKYGDTPKLAYSVEPMGLNVILFNEVYVSWQEPKGNFTRFRLVRNQNGYPETAEDGVIAFEQVTADGDTIEGAITRTVLKDGEDNVNDHSFIPINPGRNIYYRVFLYTSENKWVKAGEIHSVVPVDTNVTERMINLLPRVLTSDVQSPFGVVPRKEDVVKSDLYNFLDGLGFSYEQLLTEIDLIRPKYSVDPANFATIPTEMYSAGLELEPNLPIVNQRRLIRDANYLYSTKGTKLGVENYTESLTGFIPTATVSKNLLLNIQDSTFYKSTGDWEATNATISYSDEIIPDTTSPNVIDEVYTLKIVASDAGSITLGANNPLTDGIPFNQNKDYKFSYKVKSTTDNAFFNLVYNTYDKDGQIVINNSFSDGVTCNDTWQEDSVNFLAPDIEGLSDATFYATITIEWDAAGTYYVDQVFMGEGIATEYDEARAITLNLETSRINYIENPSFEVDDSLWSYQNLTFETDNSSVSYEGYPGSNAGKFTATSSDWQIVCDTQIPVQPGRYFNTSIYAASETIMSMTMYLDLYDEFSTVIDTFEATHLLDNLWGRYHITALVSANSSAIYAKLRIEGLSEIDDVLRLDMAQAEDTYNPTDYFDGSLPEEVGAVWVGTANASETHLYPRRAIKVLRLAQTLTNWVPRNAWWRITTAAGLEYTNLDV